MSGRLQTPAARPPCATALGLLGLLWALTASGANWYVDNAATGANNGTSQANAWTNFTRIAYASIQPGDTLWINGGPIGLTNVYRASLDDRFGVGSPTPGTLIAPITVRPLPGGGLVKIIGGIFLSKDSWHLDGRWNTNAITSADSVLTTFDVNTNCGIEVSCTNAGSAVQVFGQDRLVYGIHLSLMKSRDDTGIAMVDVGAGRPIGNGAEIAYCWIENIQGYALRGEFANVVSNDFGQLKVHHNLIEHVNDNFFQYPGYVDVFKNVCRYHDDPDIGHPDCIQEVNVFSRIYDNIFYNFKGSRFYVEANGTNTHDILAYNNIWYSDTNWYGNWYTNVSGTNVSFITNNAGTGFDITGHDAAPGTDCNVSNVFFFNNTTYMRGTINPPAAFIWSSGTTGNPRTSMQARSVWFMNNAIVGVPPQNNQPLIQMPTNTVLYNGTTGFGYGSNDVHVDFNSIMRMSGKGQGIVYGDGGAPDLSNQYTNMADFGGRTPYSHNNNTLAVFAALPDNRAYGRAPTGDFMIGPGDTALTGQGTNLAALISAIAPECTSDIFGVARGSTWDIGAFQHDPAVFYVGTNGSDAFTSTQAHSPSTPWRTLQHAMNTATTPGSVVLAGAGDYKEFVETAAAGTIGARTVLRGLPANDSLFPVTTRTWRAKHQYNTLEGMTLTKATGANGGMVRIEPPSSGGNNGSDCVVTNCTIKDSVKLITHTASFGVNFVQIQDAAEGGNFNTAGFVPGMNVGFGADSLHVYTNHGQFLTTLSNSTDGLTLYFTTNLLADAGSGYFAAFLYGQANAASSWGIVSPTGSGGFPSATNVVIVGCTLSNLMGGVQFATGSNTTFTHNLLRKLHGGPAIQFATPNSVYSYNTILGDNNIEWFSAGELSNPNIHPGGGSYYDWQCNLLTVGGAGVSNIDFNHNWIQDVDTGLQTMDWATNSWNTHISYCVFVGVQGAGSANSDGVTIDHCTFYKAAFNYPQVGPLGFGTHLVNGTTIVSNAFVNFGSHAVLANEVPYGAVIGNYTNLTVHTNFSVTFEMNNWADSAATVYTNGNGEVTTGVMVGGGDPLFVNAANPLGPDGLAFTADDGLRPLPNSKLALYGVGALPAWPTSAGPIAHFTVRLPSPGYQDAIGTNFNPAWVALLPDLRGDNIRPWGTPEALGSNSVTATLDASQSVDGQGLGNGAITNYAWTFSDGGTLTTNSPVIAHTFATAGTNLVTLTVRANGAASTYSNPYRLLGSLGGGGGITNGIIGPLTFGGKLVKAAAAR